MHSIYSYNVLERPTWGDKAEDGGVQEHVVIAREVLARTNQDVILILPLVFPGQHPQRLPDEAAVPPAVAVTLHYMTIRCVTFMALQLPVP